MKPILYYWFPLFMTRRKKTKIKRTALFPTHSIYLREKESGVDEGGILDKIAAGLNRT